MVPVIHQKTLVFSCTRSSRTLNPTDRCSKPPCDIPQEQTQRQELASRRLLLAIKMTTHKDRHAPRKQVLLVVAWFSAVAFLVGRQSVILRGAGIEQSDTDHVSADPIFAWPQTSISKSPDYATGVSYPYWLADRQQYSIAGRADQDMNISQRLSPKEVADKIREIKTTKPKELRTFTDFCKTYSTTNANFAPFFDKVYAKQWVRRHFPAMPIAELYAHVTNASLITTELLNTFPSRAFVLKASHLSGGIALVDMDKDEVKCVKPPCVDPDRKEGESVASYLERLCKKLVASRQWRKIWYDFTPQQCLFERRHHALDDYLEDIKLHIFHGVPMLVVAYTKGSKGNNIYTIELPTSSSSGTKQNKEYLLGTEIPSAIHGGKEFADGQEMAEYLKKNIDLSIIVEAADELMKSLQNFIHTPYLRVDFFFSRDETVQHTPISGPMNSGVAPVFGEVSFVPNSCNDYFPDNKELNEFYGFVIDHPEFIVPPEAVFEYSPGMVLVPAGVST
jgi:hypothetical protein